MSGLARLGSAPMARRASRMAARSTTQGTPVKSCSRTRAGRKLISLAWRADLPLGDVLDVGGFHGGAVFGSAAGFRAGS